MTAQLRLRCGASSSEDENTNLRKVGAHAVLASESD